MVKKYKREQDWYAAVKKVEGVAYSSVIGMKGVGGDHQKAYIPNGRVVGYWWYNKNRGEVYE